MNRLFLFFSNLSTKKVILIILAISLLVYGNSLFNGFVGDDAYQILANPSIRSVSNIPRLFTQGNIYDESQQLNNFYRPVLATISTLVYFFSGENPFGFHLFQLLIHVANAILIFAIFRYFFKKGISLLLSILFLVHPLNVEAVAYAMLQETLFLFFGLLALFLAITKPNNKYLYPIVPFLLLFSLFSKETGIIFLILIPLFSFLYKNRRELIKSLIQGLSAVTIYFLLRFGVAHIPFNNNQIIVPIQTLSLGERMINIPKIIFFYLKTFIYPIDLIAFQDWVVKTINFPDFYLPLFLDICFLISLLVAGWILRKKSQELFKVFLFFLVWFFMGLVIHLQIMPLDETVSDRWFYFPIIGLLGIIGAIANYYYLRRPKIPKVAILISCLIILLFSIRSVTRNANWSNDTALYAHDLKINPNSYQFQRLLGNASYSARDNQTAETAFIRSTELFPSETSFSGLGNFYLRVNQPKNAELAFTKALTFSPDHATLWAFLATARYYSGDKDGAIAAIKKAYAISPANLFREILNAIENNYSFQLY